MTADKASQLVPKLRFPEFRNESAWLAPQLRELYRFKRTNTLSRDKLNYTTGTIRNIHYGDIHTKFKPSFRVSDEEVPYINPDVSANGFDDDVFCQEGDIVFADASEDIDDVGKAIEVVSLGGERVVAGTHTILATRRGDIPIVGFGGQLFQCATVRTRVKKEAQGTKVSGISATRISAIPIPVPLTKAEQQKIVDCLGSLDDLIKAEGRKLEALRQHKKGLMQQLFPQPGETVPRLRFPEFDRTLEWKLKRLDAVSPSIFDGTHQTPTYTEEGVPFYSVENLISGVANKFISRESYLEATRKNKPEKGDILLTRIGKIGYSQAVTWDYEFSIYVTLAVIKASPSFDTSYLAFYLQSSCYQTELLCKSLPNAVPPKINLESLRSTLVLIPDMDEQVKIASCLSPLDDLIKAESRKFEALRQHKKGLMQQLFPSLETK